MAQTAPSNSPSSDPAENRPFSSSPAAPGRFSRDRRRAKLLWRYAGALAATGCGLLLYHALAGFTDGHVPLIVLLPFVVFSALYGGLIPGLVSTVLCSIYVEVLDRGLASLASPMGGQIEVIFFLPTGIIASYLSGLLHAAREFAEQSAAELSLSQERYRLISETVSDYAFGYRFGANPEEDELVWITPSFWRLTGFEAEASASPMDWARIVHPEDLHLAWELVRDLREGQSGSREYRVVTPDGEVRWHRVYGRPLLDDTGRVAGCVGGGQDITEQKSMEAALRESEAGYRTIVETAAEGIWILDSRWRITFVNQRMAELLGTTPEDMLGRQASDFFFEDDLPASEIDGPGQALESLYANDLRYRRADGRAIWCRVAATPLYDHDGSQDGIVSMHTDITERRELEQSQAYLAEISSFLAETLDLETTLDHVAQLAVPRLADWCFVAANTPDKGFQILAAAHEDAEAIERFWERNRAYSLRTDSPFGLPAVLRSGLPELFSHLTPEVLASGSQDEKHLNSLLEVGYCSTLTVPLRAGGKILGAIMFAYAQSGRHYEETDVGLAEEIARRAAMAVENARLYRELQDTDRRKDEFLAMLAHELRNPLAAISGASQVMDAILSDAEKEPIAIPRSILVRQVDHLSRLVDDLLDVSRITRGRIELRRVPLDLGEAVRAAIESSRGTVDARRHRLQVEIVAEAVPVLADPARLQQIITNLIHNAAKYTEPGGLVQVSLRRSGGEAVIRVRDTGAGIKPEMLPHIWSLFAQSERTLDRSQGGLGIGLTLVRALTEMHGGRVEAQSAGPGMGSEFTVTLPLEQAEPEETKAVNGAGPMGEKPRRILVVDDNRDAAETLAHLLALQGHEVRTAHDGENGLEVANAWSPDAVLLDIGMPGLDGYEVARRLRAQPATASGDLLLIAVTGYGQPSDVERAREAGFDHHFTKPVDFGELRATLVK